MMTLAGMGVMTIIFSMQRSYTGLILVGIIYGAVSYLPSTHYTHLCHDAGRRALYSNCRLHTESVIPDGKPDYAYHCRTGN